MLIKWNYCSTFWIFWARSTRWDILKMLGGHLTLFSTIFLCSMRKIVLWSKKITSNISKNTLEWTTTDSIRNIATLFLRHLKGYCRKIKWTKRKNYQCWLIHSLGCRPTVTNSSRKDVWNMPLRSISRHIPHSFITFWSWTKYLSNLWKISTIRHCQIISHNICKNCCNRWYLLQKQSNFQKFEGWLRWWVTMNTQQPISTIFLGMC